jgi:hypothetical protein
MNADQLAGVKVTRMRLILEGAASSFVFFCELLVATLLSDVVGVAAWSTGKFADCTVAIIEMYALTIIPDRQENVLVSQHCCKVTLLP